MTETLPHLLLRLSEGSSAILWGRLAAVHYGLDFDQLLAQRILIEERPAETWGLCPHCECGLDARPVVDGNGTRVAVCPLDHRCDTPLTADDLRSFRIDIGALVRQIAGASGFAGPPVEVLPGVWFLGQAPPLRATFLVLTATAIRQPAILTVLRATARGAPITIVGPPLDGAETLRFEDAGLHVVAAHDVMRGTSFALHQGRLVPGLDPEPRLVIARSDYAVVLDGEDKRLPAQPFRVLLTLVDKVLAGGQMVSSIEIEKDTGRVPRDVIRELRDRLADGHPNPETVRTLIRNSRNPSGYYLSLLPEEIDLRP